MIKESPPTPDFIQKHQMQAHLLSLSADHALKNDNPFLIKSFYALAKYANDENQTHMRPSLAQEIDDLIKNHGNTAARAGDLKTDILNDQTNIDLSLIDQATAKNYLDILEAADRQKNLLIRHQEISETGRKRTGLHIYEWEIFLRLAVGLNKPFKNQDQMAIKNHQKKLTEKEGWDEVLLWVNKSNQSIKIHQFFLKIGLAKKIGSAQTNELIVLALNSSNNIDHAKEILKSLYESCVSFSQIDHEIENLSRQYHHIRAEKIQMDKKNNDRMSERNAIEKKKRLAEQIQSISKNFHTVPSFLGWYALQTRGVNLNWDGWSHLFEAIGDDPLMASSFKKTFDF